jgi:2-succinyl-6-hydroxy-2,4-cyclohexadiene-1-carboxylate synthase
LDILVHGVNYHVEITGREEGSSLLLLHGFTGSTKTWEPFMEIWKDHFKIIAVDLIGHGLSDSPADDRRYTMEHTIQDLNFILDQLGIKKTHVLGYSMGGRVAIAFAGHFPQKIISLILESTSPGLPTEEERSARRMQDEALADEIEQKGLVAFVQKWENLPLFATQKKLPQSIQNKIRKQRLSQSPQGLANSLRGMGTGHQPSYWSKLHSFHFPVLVLAGDEDPKYCQIAHKMAEVLPQSQVKIIPGAGHTIHLEKSQLFAKVVLDYLLRLNKRAIQ